MTSQKLVPEKELATKYKIGQPMKRLSKEDDCYSLTYAVGQPIKSIGLPRTDQEFKELFINVGQVLWHLRDNHHFFEYGENEEQTVFDAIGLKLPSGTTMEATLRKYDGCRSPAVGLSTVKGEDGRQLAIPEAGLVYVPRLDSKIKRGILVDLVSAYTKKAFETPYDVNELEEITKIHSEEQGIVSQSVEVNDHAIALFIGGSIIPHLYEDKMDDLDYLYWNPSKVKSRKLLAKPLEDKLGYAIDLVKTQIPERVKNFEEAIK